MDERRVDGRVFFVEAAHIFWPQLTDGADITQPATHLRDNPVSITSDPNFAQPQVALRWHVNAAAEFPQSGSALGLPSSPFTVWRRGPKLESDDEVPVDFINRPGPFPGTRLIQFAKPMAKITVEVNSSAGGLVLALSNAPKALSVLKWDIASAGNDVLRIAAGRINGLLIPNAMGVNNLLGIEPGPFIEAGDWEPIEIVGLPVDPGEWAGVGSHADKQGLIGSLTDPIDAALDRVVRGTPAFGWAAEVEPGVQAPPWAPPDPGGLMDELHEMLIPQLRETLTRDRADQAAFEFEAPLPPPETLDGNAIDAQDQTALVKPVDARRAGPTPRTGLPSRRTDRHHHDDSRRCQRRRHLDRSAGSTAASCGGRWPVASKHDHALGAAI